MRESVYMVILIDQRDTLASYRESRTCRHYKSYRDSKVKAKWNFFSIAVTSSKSVSIS